MTFLFFAIEFGGKHLKIFKYISEIDKESCTAYVITPLSEEELAKCDVISKGSVPIPDYCFTSRNGFWRNNDKPGKEPVYSGQRYQEPPYMSMLYPKEVFGAGDPKKRPFKGGTDFVSGS